MAQDKKSEREQPQSTVDQPTLAPPDGKSPDSKGKAAAPTEPARSGPPPIPGAARTAEQPQLPALPLPQRGSDKSSDKIGRMPTLPPLPPLSRTNTALATAPEFKLPPPPKPAKPEAQAATAAESAKPAPAAAKAESAPDAAAQTEAKADPKPAEKDAGDSAERRAARRRPAGPSRTRIAANDDAPSIGGLIYALNQRPSNKPFVVAAAASGVWAALGLAFAWALLRVDIANATSVFDVLLHPHALTALATVAGPVALFWFLGLLVWRTEDLRLRSTAMTEVAVRLAEPDRMAEQSIASLGQAVRRQVSFMNEAVSRALGRAGELEALVHNEVSDLERSYEDNERRIRGLIQELTGERNALLNTSGRVADTLKSVGEEVPRLIEKLSHQQLNLAKIIEGAGQNLTSLETALAQQTGNLETALGSRTQHLQTVLEDYTTALSSALGTRTEQMSLMFEGQMQTLDSSIADRTQDLQSVFEEYAQALDTTLANRAEALDMQLVERTRALDDAFSDRLRLFDESILRSTMAIDGAVGEKAHALTSAMEYHARTMSEAIGRQATEMDETLMHGINAVRRSSENITRQSVKAIEGLAGQSELLKNVSENLLSQINTVNNRVEMQGQSIMRAANALESANYKIDSTLQTRHAELSETLDRFSGKSDELGRVMSGASQSIEGSMTNAEQRARVLTQEMTKSAEVRSRSTLAEIERMKVQTHAETERALDDLRDRFSHVSREFTAQLGSMSTQFNETSSEVRAQAARAAAELEHEQARLRQQIEALPATTRESADSVRRALQDQLRALEQLSTLAARQAAQRDVTPPQGQRPQAPHIAGALTGPERTRALSSLTSTLVNEMGSRQQRQTGLPPPPAAGQSGGDSWSLGDLLARASRDDDSAAARLQASAPGPTGPTLDVNVIARALDPATASAIWSQLRTGQRNVMVRSIYSAEGRAAFDQVVRRFGSDPEFQGSVTRYVEDFERILRETEARDPSGQQLQSQMLSNSGRVYLFLAHASGRLA